MDSKNSFELPGPGGLKKQNFRAELCGLDSENFTYIKLEDAFHKESYNKLKDLLKTESLRSTLINVPKTEINPDMLVIIKESQTGLDSFHRARVLSRNGGSIINCFKIDLGVISSVLSPHVFYLPKEVSNPPPMAMRCQLEGMELFNGLEYLRMAYVSMKMRQLENEKFYNVTVVKVRDGIPIVRMEMNGVNLIDQIQKYIPTLCERDVPQLGVLTPAKVINADSLKAVVWFHGQADNQLLNRIQTTLTEKLGTVASACNYEYKDPASAFKNDILPWKKKFFEISTGVFIINHKLDGLFYRIKVIEVINQDVIKVEFMDFGTVEIVPQNSLISCLDVDENLAFIPPQCIKAKLYGLDKFDPDLFWKNSNGIVNVQVVSVDGNDLKSDVEIEIFRNGVSINNLLKFGILNENTSPHSRPANILDNAEDDLENGINALHLNDYFETGQRLYTCY